MNDIRYDYLLVGAGLHNAVFAHEAVRRGLRCLVVDRRQHVGGNVWCENVEGINVHRYGAHIFHTSNRSVWQYVNNLVEFNRYTNSPVAMYRGRLYNLPFNMNTFAEMWGVTTPAEAAAKLDEQRAEAREALARSGATEPRNLEEQALLLIGRDIYETLVKGYTEKQWGRPCTELPAFIIRRLPVRLTFDNNYFNDTYQGIPIGGYNALVNRLLEGVEVRLGCDYLKARGTLRPLAHRVVYSGAIDEYFDYALGTLEYRAVRFETETLPVSNYQGNAVVNYTDRAVPFTRSIEHKHFEMFGPDVDATPVTVVSREYSSEWHRGDEPYYPVNDSRNATLYARYRELAQGEEGVTFGGRLAEYRYYDMDDVIERALATAERLLPRR